MNYEKGGKGLDDFEFEMPKLQFNKRLVKLGLLGLAALVLITGSFFTVDPEEVGVVLRFGKYVRTVNPGLNFKLPLGLEEVHTVPVQRQLKEEFGFRTEQAGVRTRFSTRSFEEEALMLTGDLNTAIVEWTVQYRINEAYKFLFRVRNAQSSFRDMTEAVMREVIGDRSVDEVLTIGRQEVETEVVEKLQAMADQYETGIKVTQVVLQNVTPPDPVKPSFNAVNEAQQEREQLINQARAEYNQVIPRASGEAEQTIEEAKGYALERVNRSKGDAARFNSMYEEYSKAPEVTRQRLYLETIQQVLKNVDQKVVLDKDASNIVPLLNLGGKAVQ
jgi:modulator of FtsH protease HflK